MSCGEELALQIARVLPHHEKFTVENPTKGAEITDEAIAHTMQVHQVPRDRVLDLLDTDLEDWTEEQCGLMETFVQSLQATYFD